MENRNGRLAAKTAIVTGAASGIGFATAQIFAREGASVVLTDVSEPGGKKAAQSITASGGRAIFVAHDVASESAWATVVEEAFRAFGSLHVLINNAGVGFPNGSVEQQSLEDWRKVMSVNLEGVFLGTRYGIAAMRRTGQGGSIVNFSSILGIAGSPTTAAYTASKGGVRLFTKSAALHCAKSGYNIRVNSIHPGWTRTSMVEETLARRGAIDAELEKVKAGVPMGRLGEPEDVAFGALYLASDESKFVTGTELVIDGGYLAQ